MGDITITPFSAFGSTAELIAAWEGPTIIWRPDTHPGIKIGTYGGKDLTVYNMGPNGGNVFWDSRNIGTVSAFANDQAIMDLIDRWRRSDLANDAWGQF